MPEPASAQSINLSQDVEMTNRVLIDPATISAVESAPPSVAPLTVRSNFSYEERLKARDEFD
jgi:hypothetical protein